MGLAAWLNLEPVDIAAFAASSIFGFLIGSFLPPGMAAILTSILVSYHLFLGWLVVSSNQEKGVSLPLVPTILTHLASLTVVVALAFGRQAIPFFGFLRYGIAALAIFERGWLFSGKQKEVAAPETSAPLRCTASDYEAWLLHMAHPHRDSRKPGMTVREEYEIWLAARIKSRLNPQ